MPMRAGFLGRTPVVHVSGDLDHSNGYELLELGIRQLGPDGRILIADLSECLYVDSGGLSALFALLRYVRPHGSLGVIASNASVVRVVRIAGLLDDPAFRLFPGSTEAFALLEEATCGRSHDRDTDAISPLRPSLPLPAGGCP
jgi:anti-anti-sigma factor